MPKTLLLADDSVVIQKLVALSFANEDIELVTVYNGDDAVEKVRETPPDLVLADVVMPGKSGYEVCEAVKQNPSTAHVPVLLLTGTFEAFDEDRARQAGSDGHITKPFEAQALVERVNALLAAPPAAPAAAAAPVAASPAPAAAEPEAQGAVYDFFDDELDAPLSSEAESEPLSFADESGGDDLGTAGQPLAIGSDPLAAGGDPLDFGGDAPGDHTVAIMPEPTPAAAAPGPVAASPVEDQATVTASGLFAGGDAPAPPPFPAPSAPATPDPSATVLADDSFSPIAMPGENANPDPMATVLSDEPAAAPAGDLFGDPDQSLGQAAPPSPAAPAAPAMSDSDIEFGFTTEPPTSIEPPSELEVFGGDASGPDLLEQADLDPAGSSAFDVSVSDLGAPMADPADAARETVVAFGAEDAPAVPDVTPVTPDAGIEDAPSFESAIDAPFSEAEWPAQSQPSAAVPPAAVTAPDAEVPPALEAAAEPEPAPVAPPAQAPAAAPEPVAAPMPAVGDLSEVMQGRIHETLEKVAWEAFADLSDSIVRQVLERVERIAWEVIPQMAETLVQEEIRKLKGEVDD
jgi:CheY-like chemotaxis protein